jgi:citrate lyase subunit beta/citryl-CoA lyase
VKPWLPTMLYVPGADQRKLDRVAQIPAPAFILDLEDSVARSVKLEARERVQGLLGSGLRRRLYVRINSLDSGLAFDDLEAVVRPGLTGLVIPKVESAAELHLLDRLLGALEARYGLFAGSVELIALVETVPGCERVREIARSSPRLRCLGFGAGDFSLDLGLEWPASGGPSATLLHAKVELVLASRLAGLDPPHDGVYPDFRDPEGLRAEAEQARRLGFWGKHAIHPDQVSVIAGVFIPSEQEVAQARRIVEAFEWSERQGVAAIQIDGRLIDYPVAERARRLLELVRGSGSQPGGEGADGD